MYCCPLHHSPKKERAAAEYLTLWMKNSQCACVWVCFCSLSIAIVCQQQVIRISYFWSHVMGLLSLSLPLPLPVPAPSSEQKRKIVSLLAFPILPSSVCFSIPALLTEWRLRWRPFCRLERGKEDGGGVCTTMGAGMRKWPTWDSAIHTDTQTYI